MKALRKAVHSCLIFRVIYRVIFWPRSHPLLHTFVVILATEESICIGDCEALKEWYGSYSSGNGKDSRYAFKLQAETTGPIQIWPTLLSKKSIAYIKLADLPPFNIINEGQMTFISSSLELHQFAFITIRCCNLPLHSDIRRPKSIFSPDVISQRSSKSGVLQFLFIFSSIKIVVLPFKKEWRDKSIVLFSTGGASIFILPGVVLTSNIYSKLDAKILWALFSYTITSFFFHYAIPARNTSPTYTWRSFHDVFLMILYVEINHPALINPLSRITRERVELSMSSALLLPPSSSRLHTQHSRSKSVTQPIITDSSNYHHPLSKLGIQHPPPKSVQPPVAARSHCYLHPPLTFRT